MEPDGSVPKFLSQKFMAFARTRVPTEILERVRATTHDVTTNSNSNLDGNPVNDRNNMDAAEVTPQLVGEVQAFSQKNKIHPEIIDEIFYALPSIVQQNIFSRFQPRDAVRSNNCNRLFLSYVRSQIRLLTMNKKNFGGGPETLFVDQLVPSDDAFPPELIDANGAVPGSEGGPSGRTSSQAAALGLGGEEDPQELHNQQGGAESTVLADEPREEYVVPFSTGLTIEEVELFLTALGLDGEARVQAAEMIQNLATNLQKFILADFRPDDDSESILDQLTDYVTDLGERPSTKEIKWWFREMSINDENCLKTFKQDYAADTQRQVLDTFRPRCPPINAPGLFMSFLRSRGGKGVVSGGKGGSAGGGGSKGKGKEKGSYSSSVFKRGGDYSDLTYNSAKTLRK